MKKRKQKPDLPELWGVTGRGQEEDCRGKESGEAGGEDLGSSRGEEQQDPKHKPGTAPRACLPTVCQGFCIHCLVSRKASPLRRKLKSEI